VGSAIRSSEINNVCGQAKSLVAGVSLWATAEESAIAMSAKTNLAPTRDNSNPTRPN
jgi:hypothetical protein